MIFHAIFNSIFVKWNLYLWWGGADLSEAVLSLRTASDALPFEYSSILFALIFGYGLFGETPSLQMLIGVGIFIAASFIIIWREA